MKNWLLLLITMLWCWVASAQSTANYTFTTGTDGSLSDMSGATVLVGAGLDDTPSAVTNIGFNFILMGVPYSQFSVSDNGLMRLGSTAISGSLYAIPSTTVPLISPFGNDMRVGTDGAVSYKLFGSAPNRYLVVQWKNNMIRYATAAPGTATWEVRLYESTGVIQFVYGKMTTNAATPAAYYVGFTVNTTNNNVLTVNTSTHTASAITPVTSNTYTANSTITALHSDADGSRRYYTFTPPAAPTAPTNLTFSGVTSSDMVLNWTDATGETGYAIYRSDDGGTTYNYIASLAADVVTYDQSATLLPGTTYYWRVYALNEGQMSAALEGSQSTNAPGTITSVATGNWDDPNTWSTTAVPTATDNVTIADGHTVTINTNATCYSLTVGQGTSGILTFDGTARTVTVNGSVTVAAGGEFNAGAANVTHYLYIGGSTATAPYTGNLTVDGIFDMYVGASAGKATITFFGSPDAVVSGSGATCDFNNITLNKGAVTATLTVTPPVLDFQRTFTVQGANTVGLVTTHTAGTLKFSGSYTLTTPINTAAAYTIPALGGLWLNNPNFATTAQNGSPTITGLLRITDGTYNVGTASGQSVGLSSNSVVIIEGGTANIAGRLSVAASGNITNYKQTGGTINLNTIGHISTTYYTFDMGTSASSVFQMSGGNIIIQRGSGASYNSGYDFRGNNGTATITGGTVQFGYASAPAGCAYRIMYNAPSVVVDATNNPNLTLAANTIIYGDLTFNGTGTLSMSFGYTLTLKGNSVAYPGNFTNAGTFTANGSASNILSFNGSFGNQTFTNTGTITANTIPQIVINNTTGGTVTLPDNIKVGYSSSTPSFTLTKGTVTATGLQFGDGGTAGFSCTIGDGSFTNPVTFVFGSGAVNYTYSGTSPQFTGSELPASISGMLKINNASGVILNSALSAGKLDLTAGTLYTSDANLLTVTGTAVADITVTSGFVSGPLARTVPASNTTNDYNFPIGKGSYNPFELVDPATTAGGSVVVKAEVFDANCGGTAGTGLQTLNNDRYWRAQILSGAANLTSTYIKVTDASAASTLALGHSATQAGTYTSLGGALAGQTITSVQSTTELNTKGYFVLASKAPMVYVSSTTNHPTTDIVAPGAANAQILCLQVVTNGADPALNATEWVFTTAGSTNANNNNDIVNAKLYYTGLSSTFATTTQIGSTITDLSTGILTFTASQTLADGTNYFWLTYDIDAAATNNNVIDATCTSVTVDGTPRTPTVTSPAGNRTIYPNNQVLFLETFQNGGAIPAGWVEETDSPDGNWTYHTSVSSSGGSIAADHTTGTGYFAYYNAYDAANGAIARITSPTIDLSATSTPVLKFYWNRPLSGYSSRLQLNVYANGTWNNDLIAGLSNQTTGWTEVTFNMSAYKYNDVKLQFRIVGDWYRNIGLDDVSITNELPDPDMKYISSTTTQTVTTPVIVGTTNNQIIGVQVVTQYATNPLAMGDLVFNANGTTNAANDVDNAKLWYTGTSSTFATTTQVGDAVTDLSGSFVFTPVGLNLAAGTNYFWLTYDVKPTATSANLLDAECTSVTVGSAYTPTVTAPAGNRPLTNDKILSSLTITQASSDFVTKGSTNNPILKADFYVTGADNTLILNSIEFTGQNTNNADVATDGVKLWRNSTDDFATAVQVGTGINFTAGAAVFSGLNYDLPGNGAHTYFWLTYDVASNATSNNTLDAQVDANKINVAGNTYPSVPANPAGSRKIIGLYPMPYSQNFNAGTTLPTDWSGTMTVSATHGANSTNGLYKNLWSGTTTCNAVMPYIGPVTADAICEFYYRIVDYTGYPATGTVYGAGNSIQFQVSTDGTNFTTVYTIDNTNHVTSNAFAKKSFALDAYTGQKIFIQIVCTWASGDYYIDFDDFKIWDPHKAIVSITGTTPSTLPVLPSSSNNPVLKLDFNVEGYLGTLPLNSIVVTGVNTADADVDAIKLFAATTDNFAVATQLGTTTTFTASEASFTALNYELPEGHTYIWVTYDIAAGATLTNTVDAKILANNINVKGSTYNPADIDPAGTRTISNDKFINSITVTQASTQDVDIASVNNPILLIDFDVLGSSGTLMLNSIEFTHTCSNVADIANNGAKIWRSSTNDFATAIQIGSGMNYTATLANFTGIDYDLPTGHTYVWLTHDVSASATPGNYHDAKIAANKIDVAGTTYLSTEQNPAGYRNILAAPITTFPITEGFEGATFPPTNWRVCRNTDANGGFYGNVLLNNSTNNWFRCTPASFSGNGATYIHTGGASTAIGYTAPDFSWLITPQMTFPSVPMHLKFWPWFFNEPDYPGDFSVLVYADGAWQSVLHWDGSSAPNQFNSAVELDLSAFGGKTVKIAFVFKQVGNYQMAIDDIEIFDASKKLSSVTVTQALTTPVFPGSLQKRILKLDFNVTGTELTLPLNSITVNSANTSDDDIANNGVKLYISTTDDIATATQLGTGANFTAGEAAFTSLNHDLATGHNYVWVTYDIASTAVPGHTVDAIIRANMINVAGNTYNSTDEDPAGNRLISNDKFVETITVTQASTAPVLKGSVKNAILKLAFAVSGQDNTLLLNSIEFTSLNTSDADLVSPDGVQLWRNSSDDFATAVPVDSMDYTSGKALFTGLNYDLPIGTTYFWLVYDVNAGATNYNTLDAKIAANKIDVNGTTFNAVEDNPAGNRAIMPDPVTSYPYVQPFAAVPPTDWQGTGGSNSWALSSGAAYCSFWSWTAGKTAYLTTQPFDFSGLAKPKLSFKWSHKYDASYPNDKLEVFISTNYGVSWTSIWMKTGEDLNSNDGAGNTTPGTYTTATIDLTAYAGQVVRFRFIGTSGYGPNLYMDDVTIRSANNNADLTDITLSAGTLVPAFDAATVDYSVTLNCDVNSVTITPVKSDPNANAQVTNPANLNGNLAERTATILVTAEDGTTTKTYTIVFEYAAPPAIFTVSGSETLCTGLTGTVTLSGSETGVNYQLKKDGANEGAAKAGTGDPLTWTGIGATGIYTVVATSTTTNCSSNMTGNADIQILPLPLNFNISAPAAYCAGSSVTITLEGSQSDVNYQLRKNNSNQGAALAGTGDALTWAGMTAGEYTIVATSAQNCVRNMEDTITVTENALPEVFNFTASALSFCDGESVDLTLANSVVGVNYQLTKDGANSGAAVAGTGAALVWEDVTEGEYQVIATNANSCSVAMNGTLTITKNPLPTVYNVSAPASYCAGSTIAVGLSGSQVGVNYQLKNGGSDLGAPLAGTGDALQWGSLTEGSYTVVATSSFGCVSNMNGTANVVENPLPAAFIVSATTNEYCQGSSLSIDVSGSQVGVDYKLYKNGDLLTTLAGDGSDLTYTGLTQGVYHVIAQNATTSCTRALSDTITVTENPAPAITNANDPTVCEGNSVNIVPVANISGSTFTWTGSLLTGNISGITASGSGNINDVLTNNLNTPGTVKYMVTPISPKSCSGAAVAFNVTVDPSAIEGSILVDDDEICSDETTTLHVTGQVGLIQWQSKVSGTATFEDIIGATSADLATQVTNQDMIYRAKITSGVCSSIYSDEVLVDVTVVPNPPAASNIEVCFGQLVPDLAATPDGLNTITWYSDAGLTTVVGTGTTYETGKTAVGTYTYYVTQKAGSCQSAATTVTLTIKPLPSATVLSAVDPSSCGVADGTISVTDDVNYTYSWTGTTQTTSTITVGQGTYTPSITLNGCTITLGPVTLNDPGAPNVALLSDDIDNTICSGTLVTFTASGADTYEFFVDGVSSGTDNPFDTALVNNTGVNKVYTVSVAGTVAGCVGNAQLTVTVNPVSVAGIASASPATICAGNTTSISLTGFTGTIAWNRSDDFDGTSGTWEPNGNTNSSFTSAVLNADRWYKAIVTSGVCPPVETAPIKVAVDQPSVGGHATSDVSNVCYNNTANVSLVGNIGNIQWQRSTDGISFVNNAFTTHSFTTIPLVTNTYYRARVTNGVCPTATSDTVMITVTPVSVAGSISASATLVCAGESINLSVSGNVGTIDWESSTDGTTFASLANNSVSFNTTMTQTTWFRTKVTNGICDPAYSSAVKITVDDVPVAGTASANPTAVIQGGSTTLTLTGYTGNIQWEKSFDQVSWVNVAGNGTVPVYTTAAISQQTYYRAKVTNGVCAPVYSNVLTITVTPVYTVTFNVNDGTNNIFQANVTLTGYGTLSTNSAGNVTFNNVIPETGIAYSVTKAGYNIVTGTVDVVDANVNRSVTINLIYTVTFNVTNDAGIVVSDATVTFNNIVQAAGDYVIDSVIAGTYPYKVEKANHLSTTGNVTVTNANVNVNASLTRIFDVTFTVNDDAGTPITDAVITFDGVTYPAGIYAFDSVTAGTYNYSVAKEHHITSTGTITVSDQNVVKPITLQRLFTVTFAVTDGTNAINDAVVTFNGVTNPAGNYVFADVAPGTGYTYSVSRATYNTVTGTVDVDGDELVNITMELTRYTVTFNVTSGGSALAEATVTFNGVANPAGNYVFTNILPGTYAYSVEKDGYITATGNATVVASNLVVNVDLTIITYTVTFNITSGGSALEGATVTFNGVTNPAGNYVFNNIAPGTYAYTVTKTGYVTQTGNATISSTSTTVNVDMPIVTYTVVFNVTSDGSALAGATVTFNGVTNPAGNYVFSNIAPGTYAYTVTKAGYVTATGNATVTNANIVVPVNMTLITYTVTFDITSGGSALTGAVVTFNGVTNPAGNYVFTNIAPGTYAYTVTKAGYVTATGNATVVDANLTVPVNMQLVTYTVTFNITSGGAALGGATVTFNGVTNPAGNYVFTNIAPGTYAYTVTKAGYVTATGNATVTNANITVPVEMTLITYTVTFDVTSGGSTLTGAVVTFNGVTNPAGNYVFTNIAPGTYAYTVTKEGYITATGNATVTNADLTVPVEMSLVTYTVTFTVSNGTSAITDAVITFNGITHQPGDYVFTNVVPATGYQYVVTRTGYNDVTGTIDVDGDELVDVVMTLMTYTVTFNIHSQGIVITDAVVTFNGVTAEPGQYVFTDVLPGTYDFDVAREGFEPFADQVTVVDADVEVEVELVPTVQLFSVIFNVNMVTAPNFDPVNDTVYISGSMNDWMVPGESQFFRLEDPDSNLVYSIGMLLPAGTYQYMYYINAGLAGGELEQHERTVASDTVFNDNFITVVINPNGERVMIYPNPFVNEFTIDNAQNITDVWVSDYTGKVVIKQKNTTGKVMNIQTGELPQGMYFINLVNNNRISKVVKVVKQ